MGLVMPRRADLSHDVSRRMEEFVSTVLLPVFVAAPAAYVTGRVLLG